ncbi:MAG: DegT/DnrJ/EryC1/StrS family aminotransferase [Patescibacteria group bacterium]|jgi:dTDP-4-amino-4,6-dideoxygalactose transaminase
MKTLTASFFTTISWAQAWLALSFLLPWRLFKIRHGQGAKNLEKYFIENFKIKYARSFYNARGALYHGLRALKIGEGDEVIVQAYTCVSVANAVLACGAKIVYGDINLSDLNFDLEKLEKLISPRAKVIIVQHTFGQPIDLSKILHLCAKYNLKLVEDCAHSLGAKYQNQLVGTFGEFSVFSFGRDKVISAVNGGMLCTNNQDLFNNLPTKLADLPLIKVWQNIFYPVIALKSYCLYDFLSLGKIIITLAKKFNFIPKITSANENNCRDLSILNYALPNCLAVLALAELKKLTVVNFHRQKIAYYYAHNLNTEKIKIIYPLEALSENIYLRFTILVEDKKSLVGFLKQHGVIAGNWYDQTIAPQKANLSSAGYILGNCPVAEQAARQTLNLPNHRGISLDDAQKITALINIWQKLN